MWKNTKFNTLKTKVNNLEKKIPEATTLICINQYNTDKQNLKQKLLMKKWVYSGYGVLCDSADLWDFDNDFSRNVVIFGDDNRSSSHTDNRNNNILVLGKGPTYGINWSFGSPEKKFSINFSKANTKFCLGLHYNTDYNYLLVNGKEISNFKVDNENVNFITQFCFGSISNGFTTIEYREVYLKGNVYDFSVDCNSIDKSDVLNIHKYLMAKNNMK